MVGTATRCSHLIVHSAWLGCDGNYEDKRYESLQRHVHVLCITPAEQAKVLAEEHRIGVAAEARAAAEPGDVVVIELR